MPTMPRSLIASRRDDASTLVDPSKRFLPRVPGVGRMSVPPADQAAFDGALSILAAANVIDWPVVMAIGVGEAVVARHVNDRPVVPTEAPTPSASEVGAAGREPTSAHNAEEHAPKTAPLAAAINTVKSAVSEPWQEIRARARPATALRVRREMPDIVTAGNWG